MYNERVDLIDYERLDNTKAGGFLDTVIASANPYYITTTH